LSSEEVSKADVRKMHYRSIIQYLNNLPEQTLESHDL